MFKPGIAEFQIGNTTRGLKHSTWAKAVACEELSKRRETTYTVDRLDREIGLFYEVDKDGKRIIHPVDLVSIMHFYYGCAVAYCESKGLTVDFTPADVSDWFDSLGEVQAEEVTKSLFKSHEPKNVLTPEMETLPG